MKEKEEERLINLKQMEKELYQKGFQTIAGIDEAGRGPFLFWKKQSVILLLS